MQFSIDRFSCKQILDQRKEEFMKLFISSIIIMSLSLMACSQKIPEFDSDNAFQDLVEQTEIGFRHPGTEEIKILRAYIKNKLSEYGADIEEQAFEVEVRGQLQEGENIIASFYPRMSRRILLAAHYDTRPWADMEKEDSLHTKPVLGANDGASGVAVLLELARILQQNEPAQYGVDMVFFDLEDSGSYEENDTWCLGSQFFAEQFSGQLPEKAIVVDMIGDKDLAINMEYFSYQNSPALVNEVWEIAKELGFNEFKPKIGTVVIDDHLPMIKIGINAILLIDFEYPSWHTVHDTPDKCSPHSLYVVGQTLLHLVYSEK
jgi:hypothetical protein